jgi:hypothetical protein
MVEKVKENAKSAIALFSKKYKKQKVCKISG